MILTLCEQSDLFLFEETTCHKGKAREDHSEDIISQCHSICFDTD